VHSIAKKETKKRESIALDSDVPQPPQNCKFVFDGEASADPLKMLIKKLLPASGIAFIGGQSGAGKTFVAIALAVALAGGTEFLKYNVKEPIGVASVAAEGVGMFAQRVAAAKLAIGIKEPIPFAWSGSIPNLQAQEGLTAFVAELRSLDQEMQKRFDVRLGAIFMDTVAACFVMQDENSNAEVSRVCGIMRHIGDSVGAVIIPIHHYGKDAGTGLRGASAWRGAADVTISVTANINQLTGKVSNRELALAKARDAEQGPIAPFILEWVKLGVDDDGEDFGSCIIKLDLEPRPAPARSKRPSKGDTVFDDACQTALRAHGEFRHRRKDGAEFRVVELKHVKAEFRALYGTGAKLEP
jgi:RecA-family ATPase